MQALMDAEHVLNPGRIQYPIRPDFQLCQRRCLQFLLRRFGQRAETLE